MFDMKYPERNYNLTIIGVPDVRYWVCHVGFNSEWSGSRGFWAWSSRSQSYVRVNYVV